MAIQLLNAVGKSVSTYFCLSTDIKPTSCDFGSKLFEWTAATSAGIWYIYTPVGWVVDYKNVAGEAHIGEVGYWSDLIVVTPAIAAAAFAANDVVGGKLTLAGAVRMVGGKGKITGIKIVDTSKQNANLLVFLFGADLAGIYADNSAEAVTVADWLKWIGTIEILAADYKQMANASLVDLGFEIDVKVVAGTTLYGLIVTTDTPTYEANALQLTFGVREGN